MFKLFKTDDDESDDAGLTSLDLRNVPPAPPRAALPSATQGSPKAAVQPSVNPPCVQMLMNLEAAYSHFSGAHRRLQEIVTADLKPEILFYLVFPQQGHCFSITTADGTKTILPVFTSRAMADSYIAARKIGAVAAACRIENLASQAEHWIAVGTNSYTLNMCCRCISLQVFPISDFQSEEVFLNTWRLDLANRRQFAEVYGRNASNAFASNPKQARNWLEGIRDHIDPANPYLHWMIALLAGISGDMEAKADSLKRAEAFGPTFAEKLRRTSTNLTEPGAQIASMSEAMLGLGISLGYLAPNKLRND